MTLTKAYGVLWAEVGSPKFGPRARGTDVNVRGNLDFDVKGVGERHGCQGQAGARLRPHGVQEPQARFRAVQSRAAASGPDRPDG